MKRVNNKDVPPSHDQTKDACDLQGDKFKVCSMDSALTAKNPAFGFDVDNDSVAGFDKGAHVSGEA
ncbi:TPA: hypothetical protein ACXNHL_002648 [Serratia marcescens]